MLLLPGCSAVFRCGGAGGVIAVVGCRGAVLGGPAQKGGSGTCEAVERVGMGCGALNHMHKQHMGSTAHQKF